MTSAIEAQKDSVVRAFYAAVGTPMVTGRKFKEFGRNAPSPPKSNTFSKYLGYLFKGFGPVLLIGAVLVLVSWKPLGEPAPAIANLVSLCPR